MRSWRFTHSVWPGHTLALTVTQHRPEWPGVAQGRHSPYLTHTLALSQHRQQWPGVAQGRHSPHLTHTLALTVTQHRPQWPGVAQGRHSPHLTHTHTGPHCHTAQTTMAWCSTREAFPTSDTHTHWPSLSQHRPQWPGVAQRRHSPHLTHTLALTVTQHRPQWPGVAQRRHSPHLTHTHTGPHCHTAQTRMAW